MHVDSSISPYLIEIDQNSSCDRQISLERLYEVSEEIRRDAFR